MTERVRIHLRLPEAHKAEICLKLNNYDEAGCLKSSPHVANAKILILENITPIVDHQKRNKILQGKTGKTPCAFLEGEIVSWSGYFNKNAKAEHIKRLAEYKKQELSLSDKDKKLIEENSFVGFNPKKADFFYLVEDGIIKSEFLKASRLIAVHWNFAVDQGAAFRSVNISRPLNMTAKFSKIENVDIPKGMEVSKRKLKSLGVKLGT
jgi:hypothetical protein